MKQVRMQYCRLVAYLTDENRKRWLLIIGVAGLLASLLLTESAWSTSRIYPLSPIIPGITLPALFHTGLFIVVLCALLGSLANLRLRSKLVTLGLLSLLILVLLDITRLQPWVFHYSAILLLFSILIPKRYVTTPYLLDAARIVVGGIYFWSGVQKLNIRFFTEIFPWFTEKLWTPFGDTGATIAITIGLFIPFIEGLFAIGFFTKRFRAISLIGATSMIILVLACLGPWGQDWNSSVWPWNFGIYGMAVLLFLGLQTNLSEFVKRQRHNLIAWGAFFVFWLMPFGNTVGLVDHYLSWSLYSGRVPEATLVGNQLTLESLSPKAEEGQLKFARWTQTDLNMVPYPEERVFIHVFEKLCENPIYEKVTLRIMSPQWFKSQNYTETILKCDDVQ